MSPRSKQTNVTTKFFNRRYFFRALRQMNDAWGNERERMTGAEVRLAWKAADNVISFTQMWKLVVNRKMPPFTLLFMRASAHSIAQRAPGRTDAHVVWMHKWLMPCLRTVCVNNLISFYHIYIFNSGVVRVAFCATKLYIIIHQLIALNVGYFLFDDDGYYCYYCYECSGWWDPFTDNYSLNLFKLIVTFGVARTRTLVHNCHFGGKYKTKAISTNFYVKQKLRCCFFFPFRRPWNDLWHENWVDFLRNIRIWNVNSTFSINRTWMKTKPDRLRFLIHSSYNYFWVVCALCTLYSKRNELKWQPSPWAGKSNVKIKTVGHCLCFVARRLGAHHILRTQCECTLNVIYINRRNNH